MYPITVNCKIKLIDGEGKEIIISKVSVEIENNKLKEIRLFDDEINFAIFFIRTKFAKRSQSQLTKSEYKFDEFEYTEDKLYPKNIFDSGSLDIKSTFETVAKILKQNDSVHYNLYIFTSNC
jgi:hypothetical protein